MFVRAKRLFLRTVCCFLGERDSPAFAFPAENLPFLVEQSRVACVGRRLAAAEKRRFFPRRRSGHLLKSRQRAAIGNRTKRVRVPVPVPVLFFGSHINSSPKPSPRSQDRLQNLRSGKILQEKKYIHNTYLILTEANRAAQTRN